MHANAFRLLVAGTLILAASALAAQATPTPAQKIANAMTAAPPAIAAQATIMDWPAEDGAAMATLRAGTNGWTCLPDLPMSDGNDPMCVDRPWLDFMQALFTKTTPHVDRVGISYMIAPGGAYGSNTDPWATSATPDNQWGYDPPHLMIIVPDTKALSGLPTTRQAGGPWVMFAGTPYAHLMVPVAAGKK